MMMLSWVPVVLTLAAIGGFATTWYWIFVGAHATNCLGYVFATVDDLTEKRPFSAVQTVLAFLTFIVLLVVGPIAMSASVAAGKWVPTSSMDN